MCLIPTFYTETRRVARKPHRCCETGRIINPSERYWLCSGKWDGEFRTYVQSEAAYHFARWINRQDRAVHHDDECLVPFGCVALHVSDVNDPALTAEWDRVKRGEVTRTT